jgi:subtilase family serine protease
MRCLRFQRRSGFCPFFCFYSCFINCCQGAPGRTNADCVYDNTTNPINPSYPGSSAWVTSVSGTTLQTVNASPNPSLPTPPPICSSHPCAQQGNVEIPCMATSTYYNWTTGGGFSQNIPRPLWQETFAEEYLDDRSIVFPPPFAFNPANRMYPEVSAFGSR